MPTYKDDSDKSPDYEGFLAFSKQPGDQVQDEPIVEPLVENLDPAFLEKAKQAQQERLKFDAEVLELLRSRNSSGRLTFVFVKRELRNFHLDNLYQEAWVLNEAYIRGVKRIATGEVIRNPTAWLKGTAYHIIRELSREHQKLAPLKEDIPDAPQSTISSVDLEDDFTTLRMAFQLLSPQDQRLLNLKIVENRSWKEIRNILRIEGVGDFPETALRKRKERALIRLRKKYHAIKPL